MARFIDLFVIGDGEETLPRGLRRCGCELKRSGGDREAMLAEMAARLPYVYVPRFYEPQYDADGPADGRPAAARRRAATRSSRPWSRTWTPCRCPRAGRAVRRVRAGPHRHRDHARLPVALPLLPEHDDQAAAAVPHASRRSSQAALESYRNTGYNEISLLSLSTSDYPHFEELLRRLQETFRPLGVSISRAQPAGQRAAAVARRAAEHRPPLGPDAGPRGGPRRHAPADRQADHATTTSTPAAAGRSRTAFTRVKLYFMCGLPGERQADLDGIIEMAETISRLGKEVTGRLGHGGGQRVELRAQAADALPVERACSAASISARPTSTCAGGKRLRSVTAASATTSRRACWKACSAAATAAWARRSSWPGGAAPGSTPGPNDCRPRAVVAGPGRGRHRRRATAAPPLPASDAPLALGPHRHPPRPRVPGTRARSQRSGDGVRAVQRIQRDGNRHVRTTTDPTCTMPRYRLLAIDIDGTLVNSRDELTPATREALVRAGRAGIHVVLATGRRYSRTLHLVEPLGIDVPLVTASGALVKDPRRPPHALPRRVRAARCCARRWRSSTACGYDAAALRRHVRRGLRFLPRPARGAAARAGRVPAR